MRLNFFSLFPSPQIIKKPPWKSWKYNIKLFVFFFSLPVCVQSEQQRELTQIQYLAWPDHGVPDDSTDFLDFVALVRTKRAGQDQPMVVHCRYSCSSWELFKVAVLRVVWWTPHNFSVVFYSSAGIGRTGVLITMETALCLMECGQPVYPLDIVRTMRDQRAMMIQTPVCRHVCLLSCCRPLWTIR